MKRFLVVSTIILLAALSSCQKDENIAVSGVSITKSEFSLLVGHTEALTAIVVPIDATDPSVIWTTSNSAVATVSTGGFVTFVTAVGEGNATITAISRSSNFEATCSVIVIKATKPHQLWGLGINLTYDHSNNVNYEWYIDQATTGVHRNMNCGPACATMVCKWANPDFTKTAEEARNAYPDVGPGWTYSTVENYLMDNEIVYTSVGWLYNANDIKNILDSGHIGIMGLNMFDVSMATGNPEWRKDRFYSASPGMGHFIVIKGYKIVDEITWFEVYDPWSYYARYDDGSLKGRDRYYKGSELVNRTGMTIIHKPEIE